MDIKTLRDLLDPAGVSVVCTVCGMHKKPDGRSAPMETANSLCDHECEGYRKDPWPGVLWHGERASEYGYPCGVPVSAEAVEYALAAVAERDRLLAERPEAARDDT